MIIIKFVELLLKFKNYSICGFEKIHQTLKRMFHLISKHPEVGLKTTWLCLIFSTHFSVFGNG